MADHHENQANDQDAHRHGDHGHGDHGFAHPAPLKLLYGTFFALVFLTVITVVLNDFPLGQLDIWVAMGIASLKGALVMAFFMHMWWEKSFNILMFLGSVLFVVLFIGMLLIDTDNYKQDKEDFPVKNRPTETAQLMDDDPTARFEVVSSRVDM